MQAFECYHAKNNQLVGVAVSEVTVPVLDKENKPTTLIKIGVCWYGQEAPAPSYHSPEDLRFIRLANDTYEDDEAGEEAEEETEEETKNEEIEENNIKENEQ